MQTNPTTQFLGSNGSLTLNLGLRAAGTSLMINGGPYNSFPGREKAFGVCVRAERVDRHNLDVHVPIEDYKVPTKQDLPAVQSALLAAFRAGLRGRPVYVGCAGGWGRTGLFLALMAKTAGIDDPVRYVRNHYTPHAVETEPQEAYVRAFDVRQLRKEINRMGWKRRFRLL